MSIKPGATHRAGCVNRCCKRLPSASRLSFLSHRPLVPISVFIGLLSCRQKPIRLIIVEKWTCFNNFSLQERRPCRGIRQKNAEPKISSSLCSPASPSLEMMMDRRRFENFRPRYFLENISNGEPKRWKAEKRLWAEPPPCLLETPPRSRLLSGRECASRPHKTWLAGY